MITNQYVSFTLTLPSLSQNIVISTGMFSFIAEFSCGSHISLSRKYTVRSVERVFLKVIRQICTVGITGNEWS